MIRLVRSPDEPEALQRKRPEKLAALRAAYARGEQPKIAVPMQPANCAFGDADHRTLYITARTAVYRVRLAHPGLPRR